QASESWVLGDAAPKGGEAAISSSLQRDIAQLYTNDYIAQWDALIADIGVVPFRGMQNAAETVNLLSSPTSSPLKLLLTAVAKETQLTRAPDLGLGDKAAAAVQNATAGATAAANKLAGIVGQTAIPTPPSYGQPVDDHFRRLHDFVLGAQVPGQPPAPAPVDDLIRSL